jgi:putative transposase
MTHQNDYSLSPEMIEEITRDGFMAVPEMMRVMINSVMQAERAKYLQAEEYERTEDRKGHANGYKPKTVRTRLGEITFAVPQVREGGFYPGAGDHFGGDVRAGRFHPQGQSHHRRAVRD